MNRSDINMNRRGLIKSALAVLATVPFVSISSAKQKQLSLTEEIELKLTEAGFTCHYVEELPLEDDPETVIRFEASKTHAGNTVEFNLAAKRPASLNPADQSELVAKMVEQSNLHFRGKLLEAAMNG